MNNCFVGVYGKGEEAHSLFSLRLCTRGNIVLKLHFCGKFDGPGAVAGGGMMYHPVTCNEALYFSVEWTFKSRITVFFVIFYFALFI